MKILIVSQYFWPESFRINDVAAGLAERGHEVRVLTGLPNYPGGRLFDGYSWRGPYRDAMGNVPIARVPLLPRGAGGGLRLALNYASFALSGAIGSLWTARPRPDAILVYEPSPVTVGIPALALKALSGAPLLFWVQDLWPQTLEAVGAVRSRAVLGMVERLVRFIYRRSDRVLVQSRAFADEVRRQGAAEDRIVYLPNTAEAFYRPCDLPADAPERGELPEGFRVMFAGNIGEAQDFPTLLAAAELTRDDPGIQWVVFGDGRSRPWVEQQVAARGLGATFHMLGRRPAEQMPRYFALADGLLVTLRRDPVLGLTIPSKVQSYFACGRPIVAGLEGEGARVVAEAGAGFVAAPEDPVALAQCVRRLCRLAPAEREAMGRRGLGYFAQHFERERILDRLEQTLADSCRPRAAG